MKDLLLGMAVGAVAGALVIKNCKPCSKWMDEMMSMAKSKINHAHKAMSNSENSNCECDCD